MPPPNRIGANNYDSIVYDGVMALIQRQSFTELDFLLAQHGYEVRHENNEWVWVQSFPHSDLIVHGTPYTREQAYEDVLRDIMKLIPIADEKIT